MIILDIETTGIDSEKCSIVAIGALDFNNPDERFYEECRIWEGAEINQEALDINGYSEDEIKDPTKKSESDITKNFIEWRAEKDDQTIAGQNPHAVDLNFLMSAAKRAGVELNLGRRLVDQHSIVIAHMLKRGINPPIKNNKSDLDSDKIMKYVGIPAEPKPHIAINGAIWEAEAMHRLIYDKSLLEEFNQYPIPWLS